MRSKQQTASSTTHTKRSPEPRVGQTERSSAVREDIRNAALQLFSEMGFHGVGIRAIVETAGISLATMYHHIGSKEDLLWTMMSENISQLIEDAENALTEEMDPITQVETLVRVHITSHVTRRLLCFISDTEIRALKPLHRDSVIELRDRYEALWKRAISTGEAKGVFLGIDADIASKALLDMCTGVVHWYSSNGRVGVEELVRLYGELCIGALTVRQDGASGDRS